MVDFKSWRVAVLNYINELEPDNIYSMEKHNETDEVFVLLKGEFILFLKTEAGEKPGKIYGIKLRPFKIYNVKKGVLHTHVLSKNCSILIVENQDTSKSNSTQVLLTKEERREIKTIAKQLLSD